MALGEENIIIIWKVGTPVFTQHHATHYAKRFDIYCVSFHTHNRMPTKAVYFFFLFSDRTRKIVVGS